MVLMQENRFWPRVLPILGLLFYVAFRLYALRHVHFMVDETEHLHAAWCMAHGQILYKDFFEHHGPILYWLLLPIVRMFQDPIQALWAGRAFMFLFWMGIGALYLTLGADAWKRNERLIALVVIASYTTLAKFALEIRPDVPATFLLMMMIALGSNLDAAWKRVVLGICFVAGLLCSPKVIFPGTGYLLGLLWSQSLPKKSSVRDISLFSVGAVGVIMLVLLIFWREGNLHPFYQWFFVFNRHLTAGPYDHWYELILTLMENPLIWGLALAGLYYNHGPLPLKTALIGWLLGLLLHVPLGQYFILGAPLLCYHASALLVHVWRSALNNSADRVLLSAMAVSLIWSFQIQVKDTIHRGNGEQISYIRYTMAHTLPSEKILSPWSGDAAFRFHPGFFDWFYTDMEATLGSARVEEIILQDLANPGCAGFVPDPPYLGHHPKVAKVLREHYERTPPGRLYLRIH